MKAFPGQTRTARSDSAEGISTSSRKRRHEEAGDMEVVSGRFSDGTDQTLNRSDRVAPYDKDGNRLSQPSRFQDEREEASAAIDALNHFIFVAGCTFKGGRLTGKEEQRLHQAAKQVGLSLDVVDVLVEQTSDPNAIFKYCMASDDAFARRIKNDPQLSRLLAVGAKRENKTGFDVASSVWRIFMHKIVQQFLKDHGMNLSDVMSKESLTSRLYKEALRNETKSSRVDFGHDQNGDKRMGRNYTMERQNLIISQEEAQRARQDADANMSFALHASFAPGSGEEYYATDDRSIATDDILSLRPGMYPLDDRTRNRVGPEAFQQTRQPSVSVTPPGSQTMLSPQQQVPPETTLPEVSTVKRVLAEFTLPKAPGRDEVRRERRKSLDALRESKVVASRTVREDEVDLDETDDVQPPPQPRRSLVAIQESEMRVSKSKALFERGMHNVSISAEEALDTTKANKRSTPTVKKLNPDVKRKFEGPDDSHKLANSQGADIVARVHSSGHVVQEARLKFEIRRNDAHGGSVQRLSQEEQDASAKPKQPRFGASNDVQRGTNQSASTLNTITSQPPQAILATTGSEDSFAQLSDVTQSTSSAHSRSSSVQESRSRLHPIITSAESRPKEKTKDFSQEPSRHKGLPISTQSSRTTNKEKTQHQNRPAETISDLQSRSATISDSRMRTNEENYFEQDTKHRWVAKSEKSRSQENRPGASEELGLHKGMRAHTSTSTIPSRSANEKLQHQSKHEDFELDAKHGWVDFGAGLVGPQRHSTSDTRSRRGLPDADKDPSPRPGASPSPDSKLVPHEQHGLGQNGPKTLYAEASRNLGQSYGTKSEKHNTTRSPGSLAPQKTSNDSKQPETTLLPKSRQPSTTDAKIRKHEEREFDLHAQNGWVDFGAGFAGPPQHRNYDNRSGRGLPEADTYSSPPRSSLPSPDSTAPLRVREEFGQNIQNENSRSDPLKETKARHAAQYRGSERPPQPTDFSSVPDDKENARDSHITDGGWTTFQNSPFNHLGGQQRMASAAPEVPGTSKPLPRHVSGNLRSVYNAVNGGSNRSQLSDEAIPLGTTQYGTGPVLSSRRLEGKSHDYVHDDVINVVVWSADSREELEPLQKRENEIPSHGHQAGGFPTKAEAPRAPIDQKAHETGIYRQPSRPKQNMTGPPSSGPYRWMDQATSMSSESDFTGFNSYDESDIRRLQTLHSVNTNPAVTTPDRNSFYRPEGSKQPEAPLLSQRGSRASTLFGTTTDFTPGNHSQVGPPIDVDLQSNSILNRTATIISSLESTVEGGGSFLEEVDRSNASLLECHQPCNLDAKKAIRVGGIPIIESSFLPMNGGPPTNAFVRGSQSGLSSPSGDEHSMVDDTESEGETYHSILSREQSNQPSLHVNRSRVYDESDAQALRQKIPYAANGVRDGYMSREHAQPGYSAPHHHSRPRPGSSVPRLASNESSASHADVQVVYSHHQPTLSSDIGEESKRHRNDDSARQSYLDYPGFEQGPRDPTSPTQLRSTDSESTIDEEDLRRAAERRGFSQELVDTVLDKSSSKIRRAPLNGSHGTLPVINYDYEAPIDSDTCLPASARYLQKEYGPDGNNPYTSWGALQDHERLKEDPECPRTDPSPRQVFAVMTALHGLDPCSYQAPGTLMGRNPGYQEMAPAEIYDEDLMLLNRFVEVASINFDGKRLSPESEQRVRAAAEKVGLSQKFIDQLLRQASANNTATNPRGNFPLPSIGVPTLHDDQSTNATNYMTQSTQPRRPKKRNKRDVGCNAWEPWENLTNAVRGWANCGTRGGVHNADDNEDDASSISSVRYTDELAQKLRKAKAELKRTKHEQRSKIRHEV